MAVSRVPTDWIAGWSEDGDDVTFPIASLPQLTAEEADAATGDICKILFAICEEMYQVFSGLPSADRPTRMTVAKAASANALSGAVTNTFTIKFYNEILTQDVMDEPA